MQPFSLNYQDLSGGLNLGPQPADIADNEQSSLVNLWPVATDQRTRPGFQVVGEAYSPSAGLFGDFTSGHVWAGGSPREVDYFAGAQESIARFNYATGLWQRVTRADAVGYTPYPISDEPWQIIQYRGIMYFFRRDVGMRRVQRAPYLDSLPGISNSALTAPTLTSAGAPAIPAASFQGVVTLYNTLTDAESNPSPYSNVLAHPGGTAITWSGLPTTSTIPQVNAIRLYRTLPDETGFPVGTGNTFGAGAFYRVATLPLGTAGYVDSLLVDQLGPAMRFDNNVPPPNLRGGVIWQERLWVHDGRNLYASPIGRPESIPLINVLQVFPDDGQEIIGLAADELRLYVGKSRSVIYFTGQLPNLDRQILDENHGVVSQHTMRAVAGRLIWRSTGDVLISEGGPGRSLTPGRKLRTYMDSVVASEADTESACVVPEKNLYLWMGRFTSRDPGTIGHPHDIRDRDVLALNYETGAWGMMRLATPRDGGHLPGTMFSSLDQTGQPQLFLMWGPYLFKAVEGRYFDDVPTLNAILDVEPIDFRLLPREATAPPGHVIWSRHLWLDSTLATVNGPNTGPGPEEFRVVIYRDGQYGTQITNTVTGDATTPARQMRLFPCQPGNPASKLLIGVERVGIQQSFDVFGLGWSGGTLARRHRPQS